LTLPDTIEPMTVATKRRSRVLIEDDMVVARKLRADPGTWHLVGVGEPDEWRTLEQVARVYAQTAYRIRCNYLPNDRGVRQGLKAFAADDTGYFEATCTADQSRDDQVAPVELSARYVIRSKDGEPPAP
jgi:hypothetical protein